MDKETWEALTAAAAVAGAGAAVVLAKKEASGQKAAEKSGPETCDRGAPTGTQSWGNTRKTARASITTNGNYEAFARPEKPEGVEDKSAYIVGSGLAALAAACFLVRDGQMPGRPHPHSGGHGRGRRCLRRHLTTPAGAM